MPLLLIAPKYFHCETEYESHVVVVLIQFSRASHAYTVGESPLGKHPETHVKPMAYHVSGSTAYPSPGIEGSFENVKFLKLLKPPGGTYGIVASVALNWTNGVPSLPDGRNCSPGASLALPAS